MSAFGPKRTYPCAVQESAFGPKRTLTTKFYRGALRSHEGFRSFRPNGTSDKICTVKRCGFKRMPCSVATSFLFSPARWSPTPAQSPSKVYRVGTLLPGAPIDEKSPLGAILLKKLEQHGYALGKNLAYEARGAGGQVSKLGEIVRSMKANGADVIVAGGFPTTLACTVANVPTVVFVGVGDPVATRLIDSLAHPGGNITGISDNAAALATKRLELIKQAVPKVRRVALLWNRNDLGMSVRNI